MMRVAAVQMTATDDKQRNLDVAGRLLGDAVDQGAELVALPELFNLMGNAAAMRAGAEPLDGPTGEWARAQASSHGIWFLAGSITEVGPTDDHNYNTSCLYGPHGDRQATYRKVHLFDNDVDGAAYRESATVAPGEALVTVDVGEFTIGMATCYDLRFPEQFRILALAGADLVVLPSAFTAATGVDHWEPLLRARAIENQTYVLAPNQVGDSVVKIRFWGHSMVLDPWGAPLGVAGGPDEAGSGAGESVVVADLSRQRVDEVRSMLPSLANRQPAVYDWPD
jgi:predicted amidohydrolase